MKSSLSKPIVVRLDTALAKTKRRMVLDEPSFIEFILKRGLSREMLLAEWGISHHAYNSSIELYSSKYGEELFNLKHRRYSKAMRGNKRGAREHPAVLLDKEKLTKAVASGKKLSVLAEEFQTTEWFLRANVRHLGLEKDGELPNRMQRVDHEYLDRLEIFSPGIANAAKKFYDDPHKFYLILYEAFCKVSEIIWFIKEQSKTHSYYREKGKIPKDHICWSNNQYEMRLSKALQESGILHIREFAFYKNYRADFSFPGFKLLVEIDGGFHEKEDTVVRDAKKEAAAKKLGYKTLRFSTSQVLENIKCIVEQIEKSLREEFQASSLLVRKGSGT